MRLAGETVLLTGAAGGIGSEVAKALVDRGCRVVLSARPSGRLDALEGELGRRGEAVAVAADLSDPRETASLLARAREPFGPIRVLINNAAMELMSPYHLQTPEQIDAMLAVNLRAAMVLTAEALPDMLESGGGHVAMTSSLAAKMPAPYAALYSATKAGMIALARSLRVEYADTPVEFSVVSPAFVRGGGIYDRWAAGGLAAPRAMAVVSMQATVDALIAAIERGSGERIVARGGSTRPLVALMEIAPRIVDRLAERVAEPYFKRLAKSYDEPA